MATSVTSRLSVTQAHIQEVERLATTIKNHTLSTSTKVACCFPVVGWLVGGIYALYCWHVREKASLALAEKILTTDHTVELRVREIIRSNLGDTKLGALPAATQEQHRQATSSGLHLYRSIASQKGVRGHLESLNMKKSLNMEGATEWRALYLNLHGLKSIENLKLEGYTVEEVVKVLREIVRLGISVNHIDLSDYNSSPQIKNLIGQLQGNRTVTYADSSSALDQEIAEMAAELEGMPAS